MRGERRGPREMYSGRMFERDMLGEFKASKEGRQAFRQEAADNGYIQRGRAMELIREFSENDPTNPDKPFANELRLAIAEELGLETEEDLDRLKYFSAVGTPLDVFHGVDGWMEFDNGRVPRTVTMDVTMNTAKDEHKADVIIPEVKDPAEDEKAFMHAVYDEFGPVIAEKLKPAVRMWRKRQEREQQRQQSAAAK